MLEDNQQIKLKNFENTYALFFRHQVLSKPQVAELLQLSMPTITANIARLLQDGLIAKAATLRSSGGRPAIGYSLVKDARIAVGVEIRKHHVYCAAIDITGGLLRQEKYRYLCNGSSCYIDELCGIVLKFIESLNPRDNQILGIGVSVQAIISADGSRIIYSEILPLKELNASDLESRLGFKVRLCHDVECAAACELWSALNIDNMVYVSISEHLGGALIQNHRLEQGKQGYAGGLEHLTIEDDGLPCYCGRRGCLETRCSLSALLNDNENLKDFFARLRSGDEHSSEAVRWERFLHYLAKGLYLVYLLLERDLILGGLIARYLSGGYIEKLEKLIIARGSFPIKPGFIHIARIQQNAAVTGAALPFIAAAMPKSIVPFVI